MKITELTITDSGTIFLGLESETKEDSEKLSKMSGIYTNEKGLNITEKVFLSTRLSVGTIVDTKETTDIEIQFVPK